MSDKFRIDSTKIMYHPKRVAQLLDAQYDWEVAKNVYPLYVEVSPVGACNHRCTFCAVDYIGYQSVRLDSSVLRDILPEMGSLGVKSVMFAGEGEPLLHKQINQICDYALAGGLDVAFTTNGVLLDKLDPINDLSWVKVSLNAGTRDTYSKVHRTKPEDFDRVVANLKAFVLNRGRCTIGAQMILLPENQHEVDQFKKLGEDIGLDYTVVKPYSQHKSSTTHQYENFKPNIVVVHKTTGVGISLPPMIIRQNAIETKEIPYKKCLSTPYLWAYIMANGDVYSCSAYLLDDRFKLGNINEQTFKEIWQGEKRRKNWELMKSLDIKECRVNCRMNQSNIYLNEVIEGIDHVNFI